MDFLTISGLLFHGMLIQCNRPCLPWKESSEFRYNPVKKPHKGYVMPEEKLPEFIAGEPEPVFPSGEVYIEAV